MGIQTTVGYPHEYDMQNVVFMVVSSPKTWRAVQAYDSMALWYKCYHAGIPVIPTLDDWRFGQFLTNLWALRPGSGNKPYDAEKIRVLGHTTKVAPYDPDIVDSFMRWFNYRPYKMLWTRFNVGNRGEMHGLVKNRSSQLIDIDPSPFFDPYTPDVTYFGNKKRRWIFAALRDVKEEVKDYPTHWPVLTFGNKNSTHGRRPESEVQEFLNDSWGNISSGSNHSGGGWWRVRYLMSATARSIIVSDPRDAQAMGPQYCYTIEDIESSSDARLRNMAEAQNFRLTQILATREQSREVLIDLLKSAKENI